MKLLRRQTLKLAPCRYCGGRPYEITSDDTIASANGLKTIFLARRYAVWCKECGLGSVFSTRSLSDAVVACNLERTDLVSYLRRYTV